MILLKLRNNTQTSLLTCIFERIPNIVFPYKKHPSKLFLVVLSFRGRRNLIINSQYLTYEMRFLLPRNDKCCRNLNSLALITSLNLYFQRSSANFVCSENHFIFFFKKVKDCNGKREIASNKISIAYFCTTF